MNTNTADCPLCIDGWQPASSHAILGPVYTRCPGCRQTCPCCEGDGLFAADTFCPGCLTTLLADEHGLSPVFCHTCYGVLDLIPHDTTPEVTHDH